MATPDRRRADPALTCPWSIVGVLVAFVAVLSVFARGSGTLAVDAETTRLVQDLDGSFFSALADIGNALGYIRFALTLVAILIVLAAASKRWRDLVFLILLLALRGAGNVFKELLDSPRPTANVADVASAFEGLGFPSGHAMTSSVAAGGIVFLLLHRASSSLTRLSLALLWLLCVTLTAFARIWFGAHWLTDTIGGTAIGAVIVLVSANLTALIVSRSDRHAKPITS